MLRHAVTIGYILAAVLAPRVCCCAATPTHPQPTEPQRVAKTCPHCRTAEKVPGDATPSDKPKCPCQEGHSHTSPAVVTAPASPWLDAPAGLLTVGFADRLPAPAFAAAPFVALPRTGPPLTEDDLLRAFHLLRC
jgi:hypothetical protein